MNTEYKPKNYNFLSPYLIADNAQKLVDLLKTIFDATEVRRFDRDNGKISHMELRFDDTVLMISDSLENYPANKTMLHIYVPDVFKTFDKAIEKPVNKQGDPDTRGSFYDCAGNYWAVSTQTN